MAKHKNKLKPILPSLREKKRYIAFEVISKEPVTDFFPVYSAINSSMLENFGGLGTAKSGMLILKEKWASESQKGIIKVKHNYVNHLRASLALISSISNNEVIVRSLGVSGILKKAANKYIAS